MPSPDSLYTLFKFGDPTPFQLSAVTRKAQWKYVKYGRSGQVADGNMVRDVTAVKRTITFTWDYLAHLDKDNLDGGIGYITLYSLYQYGLEDGENDGKLTLTMPDGSSMNCYISQQNTTAKMQRFRTATSGIVYWAVQLELDEE